MPDDRHAATREFHISRQARERYQFDQSLFSLSGNMVLANFYGARTFAQKINEKRDLVLFPERAVKAGQINAMGLIDEILHYVTAVYRQEKSARAMQEALDRLDGELSRGAVDATLRRFVDEFPSLAVYRNEVDPDAYLAGETAGVPNREIVLEELLMLWLANANPAFAPFRELFDDADLERETVYRQVVDRLHDFFDTQPFFGPDHRNLVDMLHDPAEAVPHSLSGQLEYIRERWGYLLGRHFYRILRSLDLIEEEEKAVFVGPGPARIYEFGELELEPERFSRDRDWMPRLVLLAKNAYVWLDQLSRKYRRTIDRLDQIPDEELDTLGRRGFSGLWLIGMWERSRASQQIKQLCGNPKALASAYSILDYQTAADLGGDDAYQNLRQRAWQRGLRLASDMVPNHMGIDSPWVVQHPDRFLSLDHSPFPAYSFSGVNLSRDERVAIFLEDHYYDRSDAAVVFRWVDRRTGRERYVYHGNDGTGMPWNDTAQLNYLNPETREAVIQTILQVAHRFPIIRFDAAMTLSKRHYQRLWFPEPGTGGAIPTRAEHGLTQEQFDRRMPEEFWRQVVDRVAQEAPDTLLLAEAFWLMEGYFVRTLGMHRVYNSAFMNMLRDELNANYRTVMKNTLEFDPEILKRFVNFMSNPDEETAVNQFGKGDKYFGICTMMATLPGLPMFGHGQVEGFAEKYGMEYRYAEWDEQPDPYLVERHEREIFPLLHHRPLFAEVRDFLLYDFFTPEGYVNEDVFAYSNRRGEERALVVYHNRYADTRGWIYSSVAYRQEGGEGEGRPLVQRTVGEGLGLPNDENVYCIFRDHLNGLWYIRNSRELCERGLYIEVGAYQCHVFLDFRQVLDDERRQYGQLAAYLDGRGVPDIDDALQEVFLQPIHAPYGDLVRADLFRQLLAAARSAAISPEEEPLDIPILDEVEGKLLHLFEAVKALAGGDGDVAALAHQVRNEVAATLQLQALEVRFAITEEAAPSSEAQEFRSAVHYMQGYLDGDPEVWGPLFAWLFTHALGRIAGESGLAQRSRSWIDEWLLGRQIARALQEFGLDEKAAQRGITLVKVLTSQQRWFEAEGSVAEQTQRVLQTLLKDGDVRRFLQINRYQGTLWFNKECFEQLIWWLLVVATVQGLSDPTRRGAELALEMLDHYAVICRLSQAEEASGYQVARLLEWRGRG